MNPTNTSPLNTLSAGVAPASSQAAHAIAQLWLRALATFVLGCLCVIGLPAHAQARAGQSTGQQFPVQNRSPFASANLPAQQAIQPQNYPQQQMAVPAINPNMQMQQGQYVQEAPASMLPNQELKQLGGELQTTLELVTLQLEPIPHKARLRLSKGQAQTSKGVVDGEVLTLGNVRYTVAIDGDNLSTAKLSLLVEDPKHKPTKKEPVKMMVAIDLWLGSSPVTLPTSSQGSSGNSGTRSTATAAFGQSSSQQVTR